MLHVDFNRVPVFVDFTLNLHHILRGDGDAVPAFVVDIDIHGTGRVFEGIGVIGNTFDNIST
ncbi:hypothetical protein D3C81_2335790 [compost metagenome]